MEIPPIASDARTVAKASWSAAFSRPIATDALTAARASWSAASSRPIASDARTVAKASWSAASSRPIATDALTVARASWSVASSRPMPRWREWMEWAEAARARGGLVNPDGETLERALLGLARGAACDGLPWHGMRAPSSRRLYAGLVSFVDDYHGPYPHELFPVEKARELRLALRGERRTIDAQFAIALDHAEGLAFAAAILLHAVSRQIARDRDARALGSLAWEERLRDAECIAPFAPEVAGKGDAPGDTYHYWANVAAGYHAEHRGRVIPRAIRAAFYAGPIAMTLIRGKLFRSPLFAGAHTLCDRMGLRHGRALARAGRRS